MRIQSVDVERGQVTCTLDDLEQLAQYPASTSRSVKAEQAPPMGQQGKATGAGGAEIAGGAGGAGAERTKLSGPGRQGAKPANGLAVGMVADGIVTRVREQSVLVDVGGIKAGILKLPRAIAQQFRVGDEVHGMIVESVDVDTQRITLLLEDPELEEPQGTTGPARQEMPIRQAKAKAKEKAMASAAKGGRTTASTPPKMKDSMDTAKWTHPEGCAILDLEVGTEVDGVVTNTGQFGVFLDIGAVKDGKLQVQRRDGRRFRRGERVVGLVIEHIDADTEQITLVLPADDTPLEVLAGQSKPGPRSPSAPSAAPSASTRSARAGASRPPGGRAPAHRQLTTGAGALSPRSPMLASPHPPSAKLKVPVAGGRR